MALWQELKCHNGQSTEINTDIEDGQFESKSLSLYNTTTRFLELLIDEIEMLKEFLTKIKYSHFSKNSQVII